MGKGKEKEAIFSPVGKRSVVGRPDVHIGKGNGLWWAGNGWKLRVVYMTGWDG